MQFLTQAALSPYDLLKRIDRVWLSIFLIFAALLALNPPQFTLTLEFTLASFLRTSVFIGAAVALTAWLRAVNLAILIAEAFNRRKLEMIVLASLIGGIAPFCSCEVIPFVATLMAAGAPLSAIMAFWLSSPLIDPPMFLITASVLGLDFAIAKTIAAVAIGLMGGFAVLLFESFGFLHNPGRLDTPMASCCDSEQTMEERVEWRFWQHSGRVAVFWSTFLTNALFLSKWLLLAYMLQSLMVAWIPEQWIADSLGGSGAGSVMLGAFIGIPAYLNGYAAVPLVDGLLEQGMSPGTAMAFLIAGGITCIPAAMAVWAIARRAVVAAYVGLAFGGAVAAGLAWNLV
ncbi:MAG: permease [Rhodobacteraceae bacterium]|nr:permease [Paracoccaceae bacterium]